MRECKCTILYRRGDVELGEEGERNGAPRLRNAWVAEGRNWDRGIKDERFKLGHFVQSVQPIFERWPRRFGEAQYLEGLQALEERRLTIEATASQLKADEFGSGTVEKDVRDD